MTLAFIRAESNFTGNIICGLPLNCSIVRFICLLKKCIVHLLKHECYSKAHSVVRELSLCSACNDTAQLEKLN